jgi:4,5-DOPA dioxygenase extradiol
MAAWDRLHEPYAYDWAQEASDSMNRWILDGNHQALIHYAQQGKALQLAIPTPEHFLPLLYLLGMQRREEAPLLFNNKPLAGSLAMTSVKIG